MKDTLTTKIRLVNISKKLVNGSYFVIFMGDDSVIFKGNMHSDVKLLKGQSIELSGSWELGLNENQQKTFNFKSYRTKESLEVSIQNKLKITNNQFNILMRIFDENPSDLEEALNNNIEALKVKGISNITFEKIKNNWGSSKQDNKIINELIRGNFSNTFLVKAHESLGMDTDSFSKSIISAPYKLLDIDGSTFFQVDKFVLNTPEVFLDEQIRAKLGIKTIMTSQMDRKGDTLLTIEEDLWKTYQYSKNILNFPYGKYENRDYYELTELDFASIFVKNKKDFITIKDKYTTIETFNQERYIYDTFVDNYNKFHGDIVSDIESWINEQELINKISLSKKQKDIIRLANKQPSIFSLSGYAGTGKTMVSKIVMDLYSSIDKSIHCCALSGVAANRSKIVSGYPSSTMHNLLGYDGNGFIYNDINDSKGAINGTTKLKYDLIVLDEAGMVNLELFYNLIKSIDFEKTRLFIIGDPAQLLPVGSGDVYNDTLNLNLTRNVTLDEVFRQEGGSIINIVAQDVRNNVFKEEYYDNKDLGVYVDLFDFIENKELSTKEVSKKTIDKITKILKLKKYKHFTEDTLLDLQIIVPKRESDLGTINLNNIVRELLNPLNPMNNKPQQVVTASGEIFRINDKVIHLKNEKMHLYNNKFKRYEGKGSTDKIYNGQIGIIVKIHDNGIFVKYPYEDQIVYYDNPTLGHGGYGRGEYIGPAYVLTAHKCQGNEFKTVIMTSVKNDIFMLNSNYIYSAMTRAKGELYILGELEAIKGGLKNIVDKNRDTNLKLIGNDRKKK